MKKKFLNSNYLFVSILIVGFLFRVIGLSSNPPSMHADEADSGYTAMSLIQTGKDPYGNFLPLHFQGQADIYRSPLYTYLTVPAIALMGLSPFSERFPSAVIGVLQMVVVFYLIKIYLKSRTIALIGALVMAINPWSIHLSRTGLEVQLCALLASGGILFFELSKRKKKLIFISAALFGLSLFAYHAAKVFVPFILLTLLAFNFSSVWQAKKHAVIAIIIFSFFVGILGYLALFDKGASHLNDVGILDISKAREVVDAQRTRTRASLNVSEIYSNKVIYFGREFFNMYIGPLSINYLFVNGENNLDKGLGNYGQYHLFEILPFFIGLYALWKKNKKILYFLLSWFFIGLIPAGITTTGNYAYRDVNAIIPPVIFISIGFNEGYNYFIAKKRRLLFSLYALFAVIIFSFFIYNYFFSYPVYSRDWWGYSQKEALSYINENKEKYESIIIEGGMDWAILYAFYYKIPPNVFQNAYKNADVVNGKKVIKLENIYFGTKLVDPKDISRSKYIDSKSLIIVNNEFYKGITPKKIFYAIDGGTNLKVYEVKK